MRRFLSYNLLFILAIFINRVIVSSNQIDPLQSLRSLVVLLVLTGIISTLLYHFIRDRYQAYFLIGLFILLTLLYQAAYCQLKYRIQGNLDIVGLILTLCFTGVYVWATHSLWKQIQNPKLFTSYINTVAVILVIIQSIEFGMDALPTLQPAPLPRSTAIAPLAEEISLDPETRPDIYIIILDGYGRQDVLKEIYDYDNSGFLSQLEKRGFYVAGESHSNYVQTLYAIASLMNFDYVQPWSPPFDDSSYLMEPIENNRVFQLLHEAGYTTVSFDGAVSFTEISNSDVFYSSFLPLNKFENFLLMDTPFEPLNNTFDLGLPIPSYETHRRRVLDELDAIQDVPALFPGPKVTYLHLLIPHPPFVFDEDGNPIEPARPYTIMDGSDFAGSLDEYRAGYRGQVAFVNERILEAVDAIFARSETPPVIVIMGDHGPGSMFNWGIDQPGCLWERTHNLYAIFLPEKDDRVLHPSMTPVNTFRVIFNSYFGSDLPLLEDRTYLTTWQFPSDLVDVTDQVDSTEGCFDQN